MGAKVSTAIEPLIRRKLFASEEEALQALLREYILGQITTLQRGMYRFERKYGMTFERFRDYLHERSLLLDKGHLSPEQRQSLSRAIMREEDDWLDWKTTKEMLESWLGIRQEVGA